MSSYASIDLDLFTVRLPSGEERMLTLDQLDASFQAGAIDESTYVLRAGSLRWVRLAELAGITPEPHEAVPLSIAPILIDAPPEVPLDLGPALATAEIPPELRRRGGKKIFGIAIALLVVGGLGFAATRARPGLAASVGKAISTRVAKVAKVTNEPHAAAVAAPAIPPPPPVPAKIAAPTSAPPQAATTNVPSTTASALPDADPSKRGKGAKLGARKVDRRPAK